MWRCDLRSGDRRNPEGIVDTGISNHTDLTGRTLTGQRYVAGCVTDVTRSIWPLWAVARNHARYIGIVLAGSAPTLLTALHKALVQTTVLQCASSPWTLDS